MNFPSILGNWKVVLLSFLGATTFWFFSALGKDYDYRINYPIEFIYDTDSLVAVKPLPKYVDIDVTGGGWDLFRKSFWFGTDPIIVELDNPAAIRYLTRPTILPIISNQLDAFRINFLFTDTLYINVDRKVDRLVRMKIDSIAVSMDEDYRMITPISIDPDTVRIFGPTSFIDTLNKEYSLPFDLASIDKDFDRFIELGLPERYDIKSEPPTVRIRFEVDKFDQLEIPTVVEVQSFPKDSSVYVENANVIVKFVVQSELRQEYYASDFKVVVDYDLINRADSTAPAILVFHPDEVLEIEIEPDTLSIIYEQ